MSKIELEKVTGLPWTTRPCQCNHPRCRSLFIAGIYGEPEIGPLDPDLAQHIVKLHNDNIVSRVVEKGPS